jgi:N-methylhydantoinase B
MRHNDIDPITLEVVRNRLDAIAQEMQDALVRSAFSNIIKEGHDCSAALFDADANIVAQATALPAQLGVLPTAVHRVVERFAREQLRQGDIVVLNDPYDGGTHLPDIALIAPVVIDGETVAFAACIAHHQDVGGKTPGSLPTDATDIFQEGLRIPPLRLDEGGVPNATAHAFIERNVRIPEIVLGDLRAQRAALHVGTTRLATLFAEHGGDRMALLMTELLDRSERLTRNAIANIRPGTYVFEDYLDDDGIDRENLVRIRASVTISGSDMTIGFEGSSPQLKGPLNADRSAVLSAVYFVLKAITDPTAPTNGGCFRPVRVASPEGTLVNPRAPAPVNGRTITMKRISDAILGALVQAMPDRIPAAPCGVTRVVVFAGQQNGQRFVCTDFTTGGTGGQPQRDGVDSLETDISNTMNMPAESLELNYPVRVHRNTLWRDSCGAGRWRGGLGVEREIEILAGDVTMTLREDRHRTRAWGLFGGSPAALARAEIRHANGDRKSIPSKGIFNLRAGDRIHCWAAGGAGYGDPLERAPAHVLRDVIDRKISVAAARDQYGVMIDPKSRQIDPQGTARCRAELRQRRGSIDWTYDRGEAGRQ